MSYRILQEYSLRAMNSLIHLLIEVCCGEGSRVSERSGQLLRVIELPGSRSEIRSLVGQLRVRILTVQALPFRGNTFSNWMCWHTRITPASEKKKR